jgi:hypothetical protein
MKTFIIPLVLFSNYLFSQTFQEFNTIASYYGKTFPELEVGLNLKSTESETSFGLETRVYSNHSYDLLISEKDDSKLIGDINFLSKKNVDNKESWYEISKSINEDKSYSLYESFIYSSKYKIRKENLPLNDIVEILRNHSFQDDFIYYTIFKKDDIFFQLNVYKTQTMFKINKKYIKKFKK